MNYQIANSGHQEVTSSGQPVKLIAVPTNANRVDIQAKFSNTGIIYVGGANVVCSAPAGVGLKAGDVYSIEKITDLSSIYIDSTVSGEGVSFTWWIGESN